MSRHMPMYTSRHTSSHTNRHMSMHTNRYMSRYTYMYASKHTTRHTSCTQLGTCRATHLCAAIILGTRPVIQPYTDGTITPEIKTTSKVGCSLIDSLCYNIYYREKKFDGECERVRGWTVISGQSTVVSV